MSDDRLVPTGVEPAITPGQRRFVIVWAIGLALLYTIGGYYGAKALRSYAAETADKRATALLSVNTTDRNSNTPDPMLPVGAKPVDVLVGLSMNHVGEFALKESAWTADFDISFRWTGEGLNPGESFRIANGQIVQREKGRSSEVNGEHYAEYRIVARMVKPFDSSRFPFADEALLVQVEDATRGAEALRFVADHGTTGAGPESTPRNVTLVRTLAGVRVRHTGPVDTKPVVPPRAGDARSQFVFAMLVIPGSVGIYLKAFQALFASVALTLIALYIRPTHVDCRFGLPVGGFFASVSNNIFLTMVLPPADRLTLTDMINTVSLITIFLVLTQSVISLHIYDTKGRERLSRVFDMVSLAVFVLGYVGVNLVLPHAARPL